MDDDLEAGLAKISQATSDIEVGILVNNVGISYPYARFLHELDAELEKSLLRLNCETTTKVNHASPEPPTHPIKRTTFPVIGKFLFILP
jgi:short-subunit dehydrogenase